MTCAHQSRRHRVDLTGRAVTPAGSRLHGHHRPSRRVTHRAMPTRGGERRSTATRATSWSTTTGTSTIPVRWTGRKWSHALVHQLHRCTPRRGPTASGYRPSKSPRGRFGAARLSVPSRAGSVAHRTLIADVMATEPWHVASPSATPPDSAQYAGVRREELATVPSSWTSWRSSRSRTSPFRSPPGFRSRSPTARPCCPSSGSTTAITS